MPLPLPVVYKVKGCRAVARLDAHEAMRKLIVMNAMSYLADQPLKTSVPELRS